MLDAPTTNRELISSAGKSHDSAIWQQLYERYGEPVQKHCLKSGLTEVEANEVLHELMAKLAARLTKRAFNWSSSSFRGWLNQTTNNLIFEVHRLKRRNSLPSACLAMVCEWLPPALAPDVDAKARERLEAHLWSVCLARVRNEVRPEQWQIFESYALQGKTASEVSRCFNTTQMNVRIIRHRMIRRIRQQWEQLQSGPLSEPIE